MESSGCHALLIFLDHSLLPFILFPSSLKSLPLNAVDVLFRWSFLVLLQLFLLHCLLHFSLPPLPMLQMWTFPRLSSVTSIFTPELPQPVCWESALWEFPRYRSSGALGAAWPAYPGVQDTRYCFCMSRHMTLPFEYSPRQFHPLSWFHYHHIMMAPKLTYLDQSHGENSGITLESSLFFFSHTKVIFRCMLLALLSVTTQNPLSLGRSGGGCWGGFSGPVG